MMQSPIEQNVKSVNLKQLFEFVDFYYLCRGRVGNHKINSLSTVLEYDTTYISQSEGCITRGTNNISLQNIYDYTKGDTETEET